MFPYVSLAHFNELFEIMKPNLFYFVLTQILAESPNFKLLDEVRPVHDITLKDKKYYRLELPLANIAAEGFRLHDAHISLYEKTDPHNPNLGLSHFTAIFHDQNGQTYRMHLFLNRFDALACPATWELLDDDEQYVKVSPPENLEYFMHSVWQLGLPCLQLLRKKQKEIEAKLLADYHRLNEETTLLSKDLDENRAVYLEKLDELIQTTKSLSQISESNHWSREAIYLVKTHKYVSSMPEPILEPVNKGDEEQKKDDQAEVAALSPKQGATKPKISRGNIGLAQSTLFSKSAKAKRPVDVKMERDISKIKKLFAQLLKTEDKKIKAVLLIDLHWKIKDINLETEELLTKEQTQALNEIEGCANKEAKSLLERALFAGEFEYAQTLSPYYPLINNDLMVLALTQRKADLLSFLVTKVGLPINSYPIKTKVKTYSNAVEYCFSEHSESLVDCFSVLIKNGASLMQPVGLHKLPLAHLLLSEIPRHPLYVALEQNKNLTLNNKQFYAHLINALKSCLLSGDIEGDQKKALEESIVRYEHLKTNVKNSSSLLSPQNQALADEISDITKKLLPDAVAEAIENDEEISREKAIADKEYKELVRKVKAFYHKTGKNFAFQSLINSANQELKKELLEIDFNIDISFSELKESILENLSNERLMFSYCSELIDVQTTIMQISQGASRKNKNLKKLNARHAELIELLTDLSQNTPQSMIKEANEFQDSFSQFQDLLNSLNQLEGSFSMLAGVLNQFIGGSTSESESFGVKL
ncbi:TPA: Dot/Icm T4SS effector LegC4 [Legionella pneumophila]|uniref:Dot/Icm T4SS effector LegC4 n=1 Tax=Legionella pneumophila TaxID=446 RepID=UPI0011DFABC2|nr:Dot/Icm T4SS effector LegC4 [Legionella pneumophila]HCC3236849.1 Dot/Icm T4SS effector LegC4 [Legionella pneumophila subsp. pneumophila]HAT8623143.1 Dot/Icm T4SS effector LegC4 [Legionella pneumophila]HAT8639744.1 Dot/Icm T4SS effector LegC4 [Legionella pneumophila]HAU0496991.1 Dot/Icm T4SS effector LegC4 [Legionella pneumophila]HAU0695375.1 Dot/Icm T4SS effector LegC4 [Legionella pneumophila]